MADFKKAIKFILDREGGYVNDPADSGGETYRGISRVNYPHWEGWQAVDRHKPLKRGQIINDPLLEDMVETFYYSTQWTDIIGDKINDQKLAGFLLDWYVNSKGVAVKKLQEVLGLKPDGDLGPKTLAAINADPNLFAKYKERRIMFYNAHCKVVPKDTKFLKGWLARVAAYPC